jgi:hypothetical protein
MPNSPPVYRLVIFDVIDDPQELRDMMSQVTGMHPTDVVQGLARAPGVWPWPLEERTVRELLDRLYDYQVAAEAWRADQFPELSPARTIHRVACLDEGLRIEGLRGEPTHWVPWDKIEMICAGRIVAHDEFSDSQRRRWTPSVLAGIRAIALRKPKPMERRSRTQRPVKDAVNEVLIVRRDPRVTFRVVENQMNYAYLGDRLRESSTDNFPLFLADLCAKSTSAYLAPSTKALLDHGKPEDYEFPSSSALIEYATHRLLWSWYRRDGDERRRQLGQNPTDSQHD